MHQRRPNSRGNSNISSGNGSMHGRGSGGYSDIEGGGSGVRGRGLSSSDANANILEQQNNERINELADHMARLKGLTVDIGEEVR